MQSKPYGLICPIVKACSLLEPRWTIPILTELWNGSTRFNEIRRGVGSISPALLTKRLREMEEVGLVERIEDVAKGTVDYVRTSKAVDLEPAMNALAEWAQKHIEAEVALASVELEPLMWSLRNYILPAELPNRRIVVQFRFEDPNQLFNKYWAVIQPGQNPEICVEIPGYEVDLFVETNAKSLSAIMLGRSSVDREEQEGRMFLSGDAVLSKTMSQWLRQSMYADVDGIQMHGSSHRSELRT